MKKPDPGDYAPFYQKYIDYVETDEFVREMNRSMHLLQAFFASASELQGNFRYAPEKWSVKEVLSHIIDCERVMAYRAFVFARGEESALHNFDENLYASNSGADSRTLESLLVEHEAVRKASLQLFSSFTDEMLDRRGVASNNSITPRALAFVIIGHEIHHLIVLKERYLGKILNF
jgi:uncharacterized damage-inducible protein DinB